MIIRRAFIVLSAAAILSASTAYAQERSPSGTGVGAPGAAGVSTGVGSSNINSDRGGLPPATSESFGNPYTSGSSGTSTTTGGAGTAGLPPR